MSILSSQKQSVNTDFPNLRPSLDLRFALAKKLDPRITFTRGSTGTYFGPDGLMRTAGVNEPRFDHDPITGQSLGLLVEESRQNLLTYSEDFSNAAWSKSQSSIITTSIVSPSGSTAYKLVESTSNTGHHTNQSNISKSSNAVLTFTVFAKAAERQYLGLVINDASGFGIGRYGAEFNLRNGTASNHDGAQGTYTSDSFSIQEYPNGWYRCRITCTTSTEATSQIRIFTFRDTNQWTSAGAYAGDGTSGIYIWGAQLETGAFPTSYIPTSASTVTRSADNASMEGTNFSSWYNQSEGSVISNCNRPYAVPSSNFPCVVGISNGTIGSNYNAINVGYLTEGLFSLETYKSNTRIVAMYPGSSNIRTRISGVSYNQTTDVYYIFTNNKTSGSAIHRSDKQNVDFGTDMNTLNIGRVLSGSHLNGTISRLIYYPIQLTNQQLINLTN